MIKKLLFYLIAGLALWQIFLNSNFEFNLRKDDNAAFVKVPPLSSAPACKDYLLYYSYDKASLCLKHALIQDKANPEIRYYLAFSLFNNKDFNAAKFHSDYLIKNFPGTIYAKGAKKISKMARDTVVERTFLEAASSPDYYNDLERHARWAKFPLKVWIQHSENDANLRNAFHTWQTALYPTISFEMVPTRDDANLTVVYDKPAKECKSEFAVGCTLTFQYSNMPGIIGEAHIYLDHLTIYKKKLTDEEVHSILVHEIGHALGIGGHSKNKSDIMYPDTSNYNKRPTRRDINTIKKIYERKASF